MNEPTHEKRLELNDWDLYWLVQEFRRNPSLGLDTFCGRCRTAAGLAPHQTRPDYDCFKHRVIDFAAQRGKELQFLGSRMEADACLSPASQEIR